MAVILHTATPVRVMGVDTSLRSSGVGIIDAVGSRFTPVYHGIIKNPATRPLSECLRTIHDAVADLLARYQPSAVAVEGIFYAKNVKTMMILCHARGVVIAQCAAYGVPVFEYEPRRVKSAVAGYGNAQKEQIQSMVKKLLALPEMPQNDAADALAIAMTHLHNRTIIAAAAAKSI